MVDTLTEHKSPDIDDSSPPTNSPVEFDPQPNKEQSSPTVNKEVVAPILEDVPDLSKNFFRVFFPSNVPVFSGGAGGGSLWDPILQALLNEAFTGSFE